MTSKLVVDELLAECEREEGRFDWEGTFADYLRIVSEAPSVSRLSHKLVYDAINAKGVEESASGDPVYNLFKGQIFGMDTSLTQIVHYFASSSHRLETRNRILLLLGPPAGGKSSIVALLKRALEDYTRTEEGGVYAIKGCPMQEEPLHLVPHPLRGKIYEEHGIYIEGDLCPRCRYLLRSRFKGRISQMPVTRVPFSEQEAVGIGYYVATSPNPTDASPLVGSIDTSQLKGDRLEVAGKAFRLDGEFNVANRGLMELVEIFKADTHLLTSLLSLAQEKLIKMERFGSIYADEVVIGHSNEGDFEEFQSDEHSEALKDRIIEVKIPYNLKVADEVQIYRKLVMISSLENVHLAPLTLPAISVFAVLSRLEPPTKQGMSILNKLRLYDGQRLPHFSTADVIEMTRQHPDEGMSGISPRYVTNRLSAVAGSNEISCISPLMALDSLWQGLRENISLDEKDFAKHVGFIKASVEEYNERAIRELQRAFKEGFEQSASDTLREYLDQLVSHLAGEGVPERDLRDMEKHAGITERDRAAFRREVDEFFSNLKRRGIPFDYTSEPRLKVAIEARLFPSRRLVARTLSRPRFARQRGDWRRQRGAIYNRLIADYGYCPQCGDDLIEYVVSLLKGKAMVRTPKNEAVEWQWDLNPTPTAADEASP